MSLSSELIEEVDQGNIQAVKNFIEQGGNIEAKDNDGWTLLHYAAWKGRKEIVEFLVDEEEANINAKANGDSKKPIHAAAKAGHKEIVEFFLSKGIGVDDADNDKWTPLHYAAGRDHIMVVKFLADQGANIEAKDEKGRTPLYHAAWGGHKEIVEFLVNEKKANINAKDNCNSKKPIHAAAKEGYKDIVEFFLTKGMGIDDANSNGWTPLHYAAWKGHKEIVEFLVNEKKADINAKVIYEGKKSIHIAAKEGYKDIVEFFLTKGMGIDDANSNGWTLLHYAVAYSHFELSRFLLAQGATIEAKNKDDKTSLDLARERNNTGMVHLLAQAKLDKDLIAAAARGSLQTVKNLVEQGANIEAKNKDNKTPLDLARERNNMEMVNFLAQAKLDKDLRVAVIRGNLQTVKNLIEQGANIETKDKEEWKLLHYAAVRNHIMVVKFLVEQGANIETKDEKGRTPLHRAAERGHKEIVEFLVDQGASIETKSKDNKTPLDLARERNHTEIVNLMQAKLDQKLTAVPKENLQTVENLAKQSANVEVKDMDISNDNLKSDRSASSNDSLESDGDIAPGTTVKEAKVESYTKSRKAQRQ
ncbi:MULTISPECIES: ankyrin repeat domain-containing protein [unclassified Wolbachia]|uniref:ankyrin repeat domain-containing protein n=1 Tax=unclassified Wolbachia TaxID=2640676 RepID=UPI0022277E09|nr:ankyrin repeat domain-containing protein [Wolbachia endosymbiont (group B) of Euphydryas aurinia]